MYTVEFVAKAVGGRVVGSGERTVSCVSPIENVSAGSAVFVKRRDNYDLLKGAPEPLCVVVGFEPEIGASYDFIVVDPAEVDAAFIRLLLLFEKKDEIPEGISARAAVSPNAVIGKGVRIADFATVGDGTSIGDRTSIGSNVFIGRDCAIGNDCVIHPNVTVYPNCTIAGNVILHAGAVIGSDGFGYSSIDGVNTKIPQIGGVKIERNVEIGANTTIDRATLGCTVIGENTKIDNLVQIAHNAVIGKNSIICGHCGVSGSVKIGDNVILAGAVGIADHVTVEDDVYIGAKAGVMDKVVVKGRKLLGTPAINFKAEMEFVALKSKLKSMYFDLKKIKEKLGL
jgi:UDP-3-O-[3-hydroxymyristoyl] glucosamine N-acyltransferase